MNKSVDELSGSEAIYGFVAWLTTRKIKTEFASDTDCVIACDLIKEFTSLNSLAEPRDDWTDRLTMPAAGATRTELIDLLDYAWTIIANAGGGDWDNEQEDWNNAACAFRDQFDKIISCRSDEV